MSQPTTFTDLKNIYLTKEGKELVLKQGPNPHATKHTGKHVVVIGGGVTGLTVSLSGTTATKLMC